MSVRRNGIQASRTVRGKGEVVTKDERDTLRKGVEKIPCSLAVATDQGKGAAWLGCRECPRCLLIQALHHEDPFGFITEYILPLPDNGGHRIREDLAHHSEKR